MALTGFYVQGVCYADQASAAKGWAAQGPKVDNGYFLLFYADPYQSNAFSFKVVYDDFRAGPNTVLRSYIVTPERCDPANETVVQMFNDGMQMGWGVVAAMFGALAVIFLKKSFFR